MTLKWEEPGPISIRQNNAWQAEARQLRASPKRWALLATKAKKSQADSLAHVIRCGLVKAWQPAGDFEATIRGLKVYARYVGGPEDRP